MKNKNLAGLTIAINMFLFLMGSSIAHATTYYIDYIGGNDSNNGTSKTPCGTGCGPWQRAPSMQGFAGSYNNKTTPHNAGDQFIFKGGVTWPYTVFPMNITYGGNATSSDYYGVDQTWSATTSWSRPIFDGGGSPHTIGSFINTAANYIKIDNIEMTDFYWVSGYGTSYIQLGAERDYIVIENCLLHNWSHSSGGSDDLQVILGWTGTLVGTGDILENSIIDGGPDPNNAPNPIYNSGMAVYAFPIIRNCIIRNVSNGILPAGYYTEVSNSNIGPIYCSYMGCGPSGDHANNIESIGSTNIAVYYNNIIHDSPGGITVFFGNPGTTGFFFNNIVYNSPAVPVKGDARGGAFTFYVSNNILESSYSSNGCTTVTGGTPSSLIGQNNICITDQDGVTGTKANQESYSNDISHKQANLDGLLTYTSASPDGSHLEYTVTPISMMTPPSSSSPSIKNGPPASSFSTTYNALKSSVSSLSSGDQTTILNAFNSDIKGNPRPTTGNWDIGAYQYVPAGPILYGDANGDGVVNLADAVYIAESVVGTVTLTPAEKQAAEVNTGDTSVNLNDAVTIAKYVIGTVTKLGP